jgi:hypothetical protein
MNPRQAALLSLGKALPSNLTSLTTRDSEAALNQQLIRGRPCQALCSSRQILMMSRSTDEERRKKAWLAGT